MSAAPDWMEQANQLVKFWTEQQQNFFAQMAGPASHMAQPGAAPAPAFESGVQQVQDLWRASIEKWMALVPQAPRADEMLKGLFDPAQWANAGMGPLDRAIEHLVDGPSYATLWTLDRKLIRAQKLRAEWLRDLAAWQMLVQGAWAEGVKRFLREVNAQGGAPIKSWRELTDLWVDIANDALTETHRTPEFLEAQRRLTRSSTECRLAEREIAEAYCEIHQIPTRTEVDELAHTVYELRRELRALRKAQPAAKAPPRPTRRRARKSSSAK
jgi:hypothetical protein